MKNVYSFLIGLLFGICTLTATAQYCTPPGFISGPYTGITSVIFGGINNSTSGSDGYTDYTGSQTGSITAGTNQVITISMEDVITGTIFTDSLEVRVWFDWNQDFDFNDPGEEMISTQVDASSGIAIVSVSLAIPFSAMAGTTRMRIYEDMLEVDGHVAPSPCGYSSGSGQHGECEDYRIDVTASSAPPVPLFSSLNVGSGVMEFTDMSLNSPTSWSWDFNDPASGTSNTSSLQNPTHTFTTVGVPYQVTLMASSVNGNATTSNTVTPTTAAGVNSPEEVVNDFQIAPNPGMNGEAVTIYMKGDLGASVLWVYDVTGRLVLTCSWPNNSKSMLINTRDLKPGVFFVALEDTGGTLITKKLVIADR